MVTTTHIQAAVQVQVQKPIEPFLSRCIAAVKPSSSSSPPPLRASPKVRDSSSPRTTPLSSISQEEEALERELETWIWAQQQKMLQRPATPQLHHVKSSSNVNSSITSSLPTHALSLPLPNKTRRSQLHVNHMNLSMNSLDSSTDKPPTFLPRQLSNPTPPSHGAKSPREVSLMDSDPTDGEVVWADPMVSLRAIYLSQIVIILIKEF